VEIASPVYDKVSAQIIQNKPEGEVDVKRARIALLVIIVATIVCVAGVLILPQVDLPDFVLNGTKLPTVNIIHAKRALASLSFSDLNILNPTFELRRSRQSFLPVEEKDAFLALNTVSPLRC